VAGPVARSIARARAKPFAFFKRLGPAQQQIYLRSDRVSTMPLRNPTGLRMLVVELATALAGEAPPRVEAAAQRLVSALAQDLGAPAVSVKVLPRRPHGRWGELHGLYEWSQQRGDRPLITLWMRTARQKRVVAFRTFLRTLLHEIGHHVDYAVLRLGDSYHTQGFYQRESHLFHQLVTDGGPLMATLEEQLARMDRTADDFAAALTGVPEAALTKRPDGKNWCALEVVCHVRDTEESFLARFQTIVTMDEPKFLPVEPDRWAEERQYLRNDVREALAAFRTRRVETVRFLRGLPPAQLDRGGMHATRGRMTIRDFVGLMAWHDDNHLDQLKRALAGQP
jgi:hypothetical protein